MVAASTSVQAKAFEASTATPVATLSVWTGIFAAFTLVAWML